MKLLYTLILLLLSCSTEPEDCAGVAGGNAYLDECGGCDANVNNDGYTDDCGLCDEDVSNDNTTCEQDCAGIWGGDSYYDSEFEKTWKLIYGIYHIEEWSHWDWDNNDSLLPFLYTMDNDSPSNDDIYILNVNCEKFDIQWYYNIEYDLPMIPDIPSYNWEFNGIWVHSYEDSDYSHLNINLIEWNWAQIPNSYYDVFATEPTIIGYKTFSDSLKIYYLDDGWYGMDVYSINNDN